MSASLNGQNSEHSVLSIHFEWFNNECVTIKEALDTYPLSQDTKLKRVNLLLDWCPPKSSTPCL